MTLRELRERKKLTQVEVAERGPVEQTTVSQLELGKISDPHLSTIKKLATAYGVKVQVVIDAFDATINQAEAA